MRSFSMWVIIVASALAFSSLRADILYEEHFAGGTPSLEWYPFFEVDSAAPDTMQVLQDNTAPDGDGYVGFVGNSFLGMAFAGDPDLKNYSVEAWVYLTVTQGSDGPYQGIGFRIDYTNGEFFNFIADLDNSRRLRLAHITPDFMPVTIKEWAESEIPGGLPTEDGWHHMKTICLGDSFWCYFDGEELPGCPYIYTEGPQRGYFGAYYFIMSGIAFVKIDSIIVKEVQEDVSEESQRSVDYSLRIGPNPFSDQVILEIRGEGAEKPVKVYSISGRRVITLLPQKREGVLRYIWNGIDQSGRRVSPGLYFFLAEDGKKSIPVIKLK